MASHEILSPFLRFYSPSNLVMNVNPHILMKNITALLTCHDLQVVLVACYDDDKVLQFLGCML